MIAMFAQQLIGVFMLALPIMLFTSVLHGLFGDRYEVIERILGFVGVLCLITMGICMMGATICVGLILLGGAA
jgi:hypothetical protein